MSKMKIVDEFGRFEVETNTLKTKQSIHPVYKARVAIALGKGSWLHAPSEGHGLAVYGQRKATDQKLDEFMKVLKLYLSKYGPEVMQQYSERSKVQALINITRETING